MMMTFFFLLGLGIIALVLLDALETIIVPRRVTRRFRLARWFYRATWQPWWRLTALTSPRRREQLNSFFGPLSLLGLLIVWATGLVFGFALLQWSLRLPMRFEGSPPDFGGYLYFSGTCFFTLGLGDLVPLSTAGRALAVLESGTGFGFLALVLGYLPVIYQGFSRREVNISLLDARAGTPPTAAELLRRHKDDGDLDALRELLHDWERWSADLMESHLSYPVLAYFRSQHDNQSWLAALTAVLDTSALMMVAGPAPLQRQARLTFAIARHAVVDLAQVFSAAPRHDAGRLSAEEWERLNQMLQMCRGATCGDPVYQELQRLCKLYEPFCAALAEHLRLSLPPWVPHKLRADNWQTTAWGRASGASAADPRDEHA